MWASGKGNSSRKQIWNVVESENGTQGKKLNTTHLQMLLCPDSMRSVDKWEDEGGVRAS